MFGRKSTWVRRITAGTGVAVRTVVGHHKLGLAPEEIVDEMGVELAGVDAALAFCHLTREQIEIDCLGFCPTQVIIKASELHQAAE